MISNSGVTRLQWARVQVFQKGPLFPVSNVNRNNFRFMLLLWHTDKIINPAR